MGSKPAWLRVQMIMELNVPFYRLGERQSNGLNQAIVSNKYTSSINFIVSLTICGGPSLRRWWLYLIGLGKQEDKTNTCNWNDLKTILESWWVEGAWLSNRPTVLFWAATRGGLQNNHKIIKVVVIADVMLATMQGMTSLARHNHRRPLEVNLWDILFLNYSVLISNRFY